MLQCLRHRKRMNNMSKNISNVKAVDMTTINAKDIKAVTLSFEKFGFLRNVTAEEAGEFLQVILNYAMTGNIPEFKDKYQKMYYQSYLDVITEQMVAATKRADNLRKNAKERADAVKEAKKIIAKQGNTDDNHLHSLVNRIDKDGNLNDDTFLLNRDFMAAQIINQRRGWKSTLDRSEEIKKAIRETIFNVLKQIPEFSWDKFKDEMLKEGLVVKTKEANGEVVSYKVHYQGQKNAYIASQIDVF